jgi:MGT family glycosyltransferase
MIQGSVVPRRFLFTLWEGGGNVGPQLELARRLVQRGHYVRVMSDQCNEAETLAAGCTFVAYSRAPNRRDKSAASTLLKDYEAKNPLQAFLTFRDTIMLKPALAYAQDVLEELGRESADVLVINEFLFGPMLAAEKAGIPYIVNVPNPYLLPAKGLPPAGTMFVPPRNALENFRDTIINSLMVRAFNGGLPALNAARAALGLSRVSHIFEPMYKASRVLVITSPAFDFQATELPENVCYVGPMLEDPSWTNNLSANEMPEKNSTPLVAVSFSTTFQDQAGILQKVIDALGELPVRGIVTVGPSLHITQFRVPANVSLQRFARHSQLFAQSSVVVTHCGHGTAIRALAAGVPLVCIPMGRDQNGNAVRITARGAGKSLSLKASVKTIRETIKDVLETPRYREGAQRLAKSIVNDAQSSKAVDELEGIARASTRQVAREEAIHFTALA